MFNIHEITRALVIVTRLLTQRMGSTLNLRFCYQKHSVFC